MTRRQLWLWTALALSAVAGCRHPCKRPADACPPAPPLPPPGAPILTPGPAGSAAPAPPPGEVLMPAPIPPSGTAPAAPGVPPPSFPSSTSPSRFPSVASFYPPPAPPAALRNPTAGATAPIIRLLPPESIDANLNPPAGSKELPPTVPAAMPSRPAGIPGFAEAIPGRVANGRKPSLDGLDWLPARAYRAALFLRRPGESDAADRKQFEQRGLKFSSLEVSEEALTPAVVSEFARRVGAGADGPLFVYDADGSLAGPLWYLYFRKYDLLSDDAARLRAGRLGARDGLGGERNHIWQAARRLAAGD